jgi:hypothetical protein
MADEDNQVVDEEYEESNPQLSEQAAADKAAIERYQESKQTSEEKSEGTPDGYNEDGTPTEELIGGKFKNQEELLKAYKELEKKQGQPKSEATTEETLVEAADGSEFSVTKYEQEVAADGSLSEASYKELAKKGFSKIQIDTYIEGRQSYAASVRDSIYESVGGQEEYTDVMTWASENMSPEVVTEYNDAIANYDKEKVLRTLDYMKYKKDQTVPRETRRLEGNAPMVGLQPFADKNEWQKAQTDRLYGKDAKYTNMIDKRYLASRKLGIL